MKIIQYNCQNSYAMCQATFQVGCDTGAELVCIQEPYIGAGGMSHPAYNLRWSSVGSRGSQRVAVGVRKDLDGRIIVEHRTDLFDHPYIII